MTVGIYPSVAAKRRARIVTIGNEKGGSGKSMTAMHLSIGLLRSGRSVATLDLDLPQRRLTRYMENRRAYAAAHGLTLPMPEHETLAAVAPTHSGQSEVAGEDRLEGVVERLLDGHDMVVIDTPGTYKLLFRTAHPLADVLVTPLNDSFIDLDVLARVDGARMKILGPSHYSEMIWEQKMRRAQRDGGSIDWIVMRNQGLTMMDLREASGAQKLTIFHLAARQEVRSLIEALGLP